MSDNERDEWTPSTEQVRAHYVFDQTDRWQRGRGEAFDRWLTAHDAEVLREAATELEQSIHHLDSSNPSELSYINCTRIDAKLLRERADHTEARAGVVVEEPEWQYSYVERVGRFGDVHERVTFDSLRSAQQYLRDNAELIIGWNREVKKRDHKTAGVEKRQMHIGPWVPVKQEGAEQ